MGLIEIMGASGVVSGNHQGGIISAILFLIPGFPMVTAMLDLVRQDFSSALSRSAYVVMVMASTGVVVWTVTHAFHWQVEATSASAPTGAALYALRLLCSFVAAYGFAILFNAPARACLLSAVIGALANTGRLLLIDELGPDSSAVRASASRKVEATSSAVRPDSAATSAVATAKNDVAQVMSLASAPDTRASCKVARTAGSVSRAGIRPGNLTASSCHAGATLSSRTLPVESVLGHD